MRRQLRAIALLPGLGAVVVPLVVLLLTDFELASPIQVVIGIAFICGGLALMYRTIALFAREGKGTLAPWDPTQKLVVRGPYRYVRNPMITGVLAVLVGEALVFASPGIAIWAAIFLLANAIWFPRVEEPALRRRFGAEYDDYARNVPRWLPRRTPWDTSTG